MESMISQSQMELLKICGIICIILGLFSSLMKYRSDAVKRSIVGIELGAGILLFADLFSYIYIGDTSRTGIIAARICCFLSFFMICFETFFINMYIQSLLLGRDKLKLRNLPKRIKAGYAVSVVGMLMVIVSQFTGLYYTFDADNNYVRSPMFLLSYLFPVAVILIQATIVAGYRSYISKGVVLSLFVCTVVPVTGSIFQKFNSGGAALDISVGFTAIVIYMFSLVSQNNLLVRSSSTDALTDLPNQYGFLDESEKAISSNPEESYISVYFDISGMSQYNRRFGSEAGDEIIKSYALYISEHIDKNEILARLGGNYFIALVKKENSEKFIDMLEDVPVTVKTGSGTENLSISASAGGYELPDDGVSSDQIIGNAAMALHVAKNIRKKHFIMMTEELQKEFQQSRMLDEKIPEAFRRESFKAFYQPKVSLETMELCGAEALARWIKDDGSVYPPSEFIPHMERNESICRLDFYILEHVCADIVEWLDRGITPPCISVNFSRRNLGNPILAEEIYNVVRKYNVSDYIQIEITETIDEYPLSYLKGVVDALQRYGLTVAIDDFGTGSSSINLLREINFDVLKIDRQFIECHCEKEKRLLSHIISMARDIDSKIIAEGVENSEQLTMLKELGCREIQGYIFDKPLSREIFEERLISRKYTVKG